MTITIQEMQIRENALRKTMASRLGLSGNTSLTEARRILLERRERVAALRELNAVIDAAVFASCAGGIGYREEYRAQLDFELADLNRMENVVAVFDELFPCDVRQG